MLLSSHEKVCEKPQSFFPSKPVLSEAKVRVWMKRTTRTFASLRTGFAWLLTRVLK
jgi:hypothetical protein